MFESLNKLKNLPRETKVYCGHEYTKKNLEFCIKYDLYNKLLKEKEKLIDLKLKNNLPTIPTSIKDELDTNIFLRCDNYSLKKALKLVGSTDQEIFTKLRDLKDSF